MGVCGSSSICGSKENINSTSNMQQPQKQQSLSSAKDVFEHDRRLYNTQETTDETKIVASPSSPSLSSSDLIHPPRPNVNMSASRRTHSNLNPKIIKDTSSESDEPKPYQPTPPNVTTLPHKTRISRNVADKSSLNSPANLKPPGPVKTRKSNKYMKLSDDLEPRTQTNSNSEVDDIPTPLSCKAPNNSNSNSSTFVRERGAVRHQASSQDIMTAAEYALMEDSNTKNMDDYAGLITPSYPTPSINLHNLSSPYYNNKITDVKSKSKSSQSIDRDHLSSPHGAYPLDFEDNHKSDSRPQNLKTQSVDSMEFNQHKANQRELGMRRNGGGSSYQPGPMSNFNLSTACDHSQSSMTQNNQMIQHTKFNMDDNIIINQIYATTREPNLSISARNGGAFNNNMNNKDGQFPQRHSSTSSDFAHLMESGHHRNSKTGDDNSDFIKWRFSRGDSMGNNLNANQSVAGSTKFDSLSSIPITDVVVESVNSTNFNLTDL